MSNLLITRACSIHVRNQNLTIDIHRNIDGGTCDFLIAKPLVAWQQSMPDSHVWKHPAGLQTAWLAWLLAFLSIPQDEIDAISAEVDQLYRSDAQPGGGFHLAFAPHPG